MDVFERELCCRFFRLWIQKGRGFRLFVQRCTAVAEHSMKEGVAYHSSDTSIDLTLVAYLAFSFCGVDVEVNK